MMEFLLTFIPDNVFQFLIGRVKSLILLVLLNRSKLFQFLIGRVKRKIAYLNNQADIYVSIPYR